MSEEIKTLTVECIHKWGEAKIARWHRFLGYWDWVYKTCAICSDKWMAFEPKPTTFIGNIKNIP